MLSTRIIQLIWVVGTAASIEIVRDIIRERRRKKIQAELLERRGGTERGVLYVRGPIRNQPLACRKCNVVDQTVAWVYMGPDDIIPFCFDCRRKRLTTREENPAEG